MFSLPESGCASLRSSMNAARRAVESRRSGFVPALNEQYPSNPIITPSAPLILGPAGLSRLRRALRIWLRPRMRCRARQSNCVLIRLERTKPIQPDHHAIRSTHSRAGGIIPTSSGSANLASPKDALSRTAVELRSHPALNEQNPSNPIITPSAPLILGPAGFEPMIRQQKTTDVRRSPFYEILAAMDIDGCQGHSNRDSNLLSMSCVWKSPKSRFWIAQFTDHTGRRRNRSTKTTDRRKAQKLAEHYEAAYARKRTARQIREVIASAYAEITGEQLVNKSSRSFSQSWLAAKRHEVAESTLEFYKKAADKFLTHLGALADADLAEITREHVLDFRNREAETLAPKTVNHDLKAVKMLFLSAKRDGLIADNPAEDVKTVASAERSGRDVPSPWMNSVRFSLWQMTNGEA